MSFLILLVGAGIVLIGFLFRRSHKKLERLCTAQTTGEVVSIERRESAEVETDSDGHRRRTRSVTYYPVFQYTANGQSIKRESSTGTSRPRFSVGQTVAVRYDPKKPERFYVPEDKSAAQFGIYLMLFGALVVIFGMISIFVPMTS